MPGIHCILLFVSLCLWSQLPVLAGTSSQEEAAPQTWGGLWSESSQGMLAAAPAAAADLLCMISFWQQSMLSFIYKKNPPPTAAWTDSLSWKKKVDQDSKSPTPSAGILGGTWKAGRGCLSQGPTLVRSLPGVGQPQQAGREGSCLPELPGLKGTISHILTVLWDKQFKDFFPSDTSFYLLFITLTTFGYTSSVSPPEYVPHITRITKYPAGDGDCVCQSQWSARRAGFAPGSQYL